MSNGSRGSGSGPSVAVKGLRASGFDPKVLLVFAAAAFGGACATGVYVTDCAPLDQLACPRAAEIGRGAESVVASVFLVGDAGYPGKPKAVVNNRELVLERLRRDLEAKLATSDTVLVAFLGDNIYPDGLRDGTGTGGRCPGSPFCRVDAEQLDAQIDAVPPGVGAYFIPGNHDWGQTSAGGTAYRLVRNQGLYLEGTAAELVPSAGCPGPIVKDVPEGDERRLRLIFLDTHWLLLPEGARPDQSSTPPPPCPGVTEEQVYERLRDALETAGDSPVLVLAHHPLRTHGSHAGHSSGFTKLANLHGLNAQDLNSRPYKRLIGRLEQLLARAAEGSGGAVGIAAGHEHSLQVMHDAGSGVHYLVSGAGSKLSKVGEGDDLEFGAGLPGYMRVDVLEDGATVLYVTAGCPPKELGDPLGATVTHEGGLTCGVGEFKVAFVKELD